MDSAVSFDGTWAKRGFTSLTGVVFVPAVDTEVLDYHVLAKECRKCTLEKVNVKLIRSLSIYPPIKVILISQAAHLQWRLKELKYCGAGLWNFTQFGTSGWYVMGIAKLMLLRRTHMINARFTSTEDNRKTFNES